MESVGIYAAGVLTGSCLFYVAFIVGRHTSYQDKNIPTPPSPLPDAPKTILSAINKQEPKKPIGWVTDEEDPSMANYRPEGM